MKKIISFLIFLLIVNTGLCAYCEELPQDESPNIEVVDVKPSIFTSKTEREIKAHILNIYGEENLQNIYDKVSEIAQNTINNRSLDLKRDDFKRNSDWYKDEIIYMFYVDQFGTITDGKPNQFKDTENMLGYLKDLGVTTLYMLPFADSPMEDSGFDVKNPTDIRKDLGGKEQFESFIKKAKEQGFKIKADLVLNHFSEQHEWFQDILNGDESKINYFIAAETLPRYQKYVDEKLGHIVEYKEDDGSVSKRRLIFPEISENHYRKVQVNGNDYFFYHTFYPFQLDINWQNPEVLYYNLETLNYWANLGIDIFRLDAIPYLIKEKGTKAENLEKTHEVIKLLSVYLQAVAPRTVMQAEACQLPKDVIPYFGTERKNTVLVNNREKDLKRTDEVQIAYNFPEMPALWATFITEDNSYFKKSVTDLPKIPDTASWATFLRVHDELTLEMVTPELRNLIYDSLAPKGAPFRKGYGVSGRMANFLDEDYQHINMAFSVLLSLPGIPIIYYGDEIGAKNNYENAQKNAVTRKNLSKVKLLSFFDSRDINRGLLTKDAFYNASKENKSYSGKIYHNVQNMINLRKNIPALSRGSLTVLDTDKHILAYIRSYKGEKYLIVNNLSDRRCIAEIDLPKDIILKGLKNQQTVTLTNILNNQEFKLKLFLKNNKTRLLMYAHSFVWLKLP